MNITFFVSALAIIAAATALTVEGIKNVLKSMDKDCNSTVLAVIVSVVLSIGASIGYIIYTSTAVTAPLIVLIIAFAFLSFLCATVGYDKVVKEIIEKLIQK